LWGGSAGADTLIGGTGNDTFIVDRLTGVTIQESSGGGNDTVRASVTHTLAANVENLVLTGTAAINGTGNALANVLTGNSAANTLDGAGGNDVFIALNGDGNDRFIGGAGTDTIDFSQVTTAVAISLVDGRATGTQSGSDRIETIENIIGSMAGDHITAGTGVNVLTGGGGNDVFAWRTTGAAGNGTTRDIITDFMKGADRIDLSGIDANTRVVGDQAFTLLNLPGAAFTNTPGQLRYAYEAGNTIISGDVNGDGIADFQIQLTGTITLSIGDFTP
ncbi:MAG: M10 family metallopeptidase C-terminal domain-containing protein, partial [Planctomycetes bacterium]|nr:M10 family metallopeptidase C-terminal domain-containing protein [Planctomycetota bacterium]